MGHSISTVSFIKGQLYNHVYCTAVFINLPPYKPFIQLLKA